VDSTHTQLDHDSKSVCFNKMKSFAGYCARLCHVVTMIESFSVLVRAKQLLDTLITGSGYTVVCVRAANTTRDASTASVGCRGLKEVVPRN
jgi:hypothetical protein